MTATIVFLPGKSHGQRSLVGYNPWGPKESDMTEQLTHSHCSDGMGCVLCVFVCICMSWCFTNNLGNFSLHIFLLSYTLHVFSVIYRYSFFPSGE